MRRALIVLAAVSAMAVLAAQNAPPPRRNIIIFVADGLRPGSVNAQDAPTLLRVRTETGRTHQIRVHMLAYNHPVVGDTLYFNKKLNRKRDLELGRLFLHATRLCFDDFEGKRVCFEAMLPIELEEFLQMLK